MARITIEDCLNTERNRFALVMLASKRAKELLGGSKCLIKNCKNKTIVQSLREIATGQVRFMTPEEIDAKLQAAQEALEAENTKFVDTPSLTATEEADNLFKTLTENVDDSEATADDSKSEAPAEEISEEKTSAEKTSEEE